MENINFIAAGALKLNSKISLSNDISSYVQSFTEKYNNTAVVDRLIDLSNFIEHSTRYNTTGLILSNMLTATAWMSNPIPVIAGKKYRFSTAVTSSGRAVTIYGDDTSSGKAISATPNPGSSVFEYVDLILDCDNILLAKPNAKYAVISKFLTSSPSLPCPTVYELSATFENATESFEYTQALINDINVNIAKINQNLSHKDDIFYEKHYLAIGDSYTAKTSFPDYVDKNGKQGISSDGYSELYDQYRIYPVCIAERHDMVLDNWGRSGSNIYTNANVQSILTSSSLSSSTRNLLIAADYITIMYGINDNLDHIGLSTDVYDASLTTLSNNTTWGTWNSFLSAVLELNPTVKIGYVVPFGLMYSADDVIRNEKLQIVNLYKLMALHWGIPVLDMYCDPNVPIVLLPHIGQQIEINLFAVDARTLAFKNPSGAVIHPGILGHRYVSTIIEDFMRRI